MAPLGVVLHSETPALWKQSKFHPSYTVKSCLTPRQTTQPTKINKMQQNTKQANKWETKRLSLSCSTTGFFFFKVFLSSRFLFKMGSSFVLETCFETAMKSRLSLNICQSFCVDPLSASFRGGRQQVWIHLFQLQLIFSVRKSILEGVEEITWNYMGIRYRIIRKQFQ